MASRTASRAPSRSHSRTASRVSNVPPPSIPVPKARSPSQNLSVQQQQQGGSSSASSANVGSSLLVHNHHSQQQQQPLPQQQDSIKKSRRPTEELKEMDEGYSSMPVMEGPESARPSTAAAADAPVPPLEPSESTAQDTDDLADLYAAKAQITFSRVPPPQPRIVLPGRPNAEPIPVPVTAADEHDGSEEDDVVPEMPTATLATLSATRDHLTRLRDEHIIEMDEHEPETGTEDGDEETDSFGDNDRVAASMAAFAERSTSRSSMGSITSSGGVQSRLSARYPGSMSPPFRSASLHGSRPALIPALAHPAAAATAGVAAGVAVAAAPEAGDDGDGNSSGSSNASDGDASSSASSASVTRARHNHDIRFSATDSNNHSLSGSDKSSSQTPQQSRGANAGAPPLINRVALGTSTGSMSIESPFGVVGGTHISLLRKWAPVNDLVSAGAVRNFDGEFDPDDSDDGDDSDENDDEVGQIMGDGLPFRYDLSASGSKRNADRIASIDGGDDSESGGSSRVDRVADISQHGSSMGELYSEDSSSNRDDSMSSKSDEVDLSTWDPRSSDSGQTIVRSARPAPLDIQVMAAASAIPQVSVTGSALVSSPVISNDVPQADLGLRGAIVDSPIVPDDWGYFIYEAHLAEQRQQQQQAREKEAAAAAAALALQQQQQHQSHHQQHKFLFRNINIKGQPPGFIRKGGVGGQSGSQAQLASSSGTFPPSASMSGSTLAPSSPYASTATASTLLSPSAGFMQAAASPTSPIPTSHKNRPWSAQDAVLQQAQLQQQHQQAQQQQQPGISSPNNNGGGVGAKHRSWFRPREIPLPPLFKKLYTNKPSEDGVSSSKTPPSTPLVSMIGAPQQQSQQQPQQSGQLSQSTHTAGPPHTAGPTQGMPISSGSASSIGLPHSTATGFVKSAVKRDQAKQGSASSVNSVSSLGVGGGPGPSGKKSPALLKRFITAYAANKDKTGASASGSATGDLASASATVPVKRTGMSGIASGSAVSPSPIHTGKNAKPALPIKAVTAATAVVQQASGPARPIAPPAAGTAIQPTAVHLNHASIMHKPTLAAQALGGTHSSAQTLSGSDGLVAGAPAVTAGSAGTTGTAGLLVGMNASKTFDDDTLLLEYHGRKEKTRFESSYKILKQIGSGGHSTVRLATRLSDDALVVCKFIHGSSVWHWYMETGPIPLQPITAPPTRVSSQDGCSPLPMSRNSLTSPSSPSTLEHTSPIATSMSSAYGTSPPPTLGRPSTPTPRPSSSTSPTAKPLTRKIPLEIHMMRQFTARGNPHMIRYFEHFEINERFIIVMEYLGQDWMDLYDYIEMYGPVPEAHTRQIFRQVVDTIAGMHRLGYCHNDIKDENIMIHTKTREIKLIDFGSTTKLEPGISTNIFYGTKKFAAPEAIQGKSYFPDAHEVWALGTLLYVLLFKMDPFKSDDEVLDLDIEKRINRLRFPGIYGKSISAVDVSDAGVKLLTALMSKDWKRRPKVADILSFDFFRVSDVESGAVVGSRLVSSSGGLSDDGGDGGVGGQDAAALAEAQWNRRLELARGVGNRSKSWHGLSPAERDVAPVRIVSPLAAGSMDKVVRHLDSGSSDDYSSKEISMDSSGSQLMSLAVLSGVAVPSPAGSAAASLAVPASVHEPARLIPQPLMQTLSSGTSRSVGAQPQSQQPTLQQQQHLQIQKQYGKFSA